MEKINIVVSERNPLMLSGILNFFDAYQNMYNILDVCKNINEVLACCKKRKEVDILLLTEFPEHLIGTELIKMLVHAGVNEKILAYFDKASYMNSDEIINSGAKGLVWKSSNPILLNRAIDSLVNGYSYIDDGSSDSTYCIRKSSYSILTKREKEILQIIADGKTNKEIARLLNLSSKTIETHRLNLMRKLDVHNGIELLKVALKMGVCTI